MSQVLIKNTPTIQATDTPSVSVLTATTRVETPTIGISSGNQHAIPAGTDALVSVGATQTLTNKTISGASNTVTNIGNASLVNSSITVNGAPIALGGSVTVSAQLSSFYGDGSDGAAVLDGTNTFSFASKAGSIYTLNRDIVLTTLTVNGGATLITNTFKVYASVSVTNSGTIHNNGNNSTGITAGTAGGAGANGPLGVGTGGSNGVTNNSASNPVNVTDGLGGKGGDGGSADVTHTGGVAPAITAPNISRGTLRILNLAIVGHFIGSSAIAAVRPGGGGGGGGSNNATAVSGGGGGGGGVMVLASPIITNNGAISCNGGNGANASAAGGTAGGGGGGGGGVCIVISGNFTGNTPTAAGGSAGTGAGSPSSSATAGASGTVLLLN